MRFEFALVGVIAVAGCAQERAYTAGRCPHCQQFHTVADVQHPAASNGVSPVRFTDADAPAPLPHLTTPSGLAPVPAVPAAEE